MYKNWLLRFAPIKGPPKLTFEPQKWRFRLKTLSFLSFFFGNDKENHQKNKDFLSLRKEGKNSQKNKNRRESSGGMEWLGVWNYIFSGSEFSNFGAWNFAKIALSAEFRGVSCKFRPLKNIFWTLENGDSIRHQSIPRLSAGRKKFLAGPKKGIPKKEGKEGQGMSLCQRFRKLMGDWFITTTGCWPVGGAMPVKTSTGNHFPRKYQRIPRNDCHYWCWVFVQFLPFSTVLVIFSGLAGRGLATNKTPKTAKKFARNVSPFSCRKEASISGIGRISSRQPPLSANPFSKLPTWC